MNINTYLCSSTHRHIPTPHPHTCRHTKHPPTAGRTREEISNYVHSTSGAGRGRGAPASQPQIRKPPQRSHKCRNKKMQDANLQRTLFIQQTARILPAPTLAAFALSFRFPPLHAPPSTDGLLPTAMSRARAPNTGEQVAACAASAARGGASGGS